jgi:hypothetical protein
MKNPLKRLLSLVLVFGLLVDPGTPLWAKSFTASPTPGSMNPHSARFQENALNARALSILHAIQPSSQFLSPKLAAYLTAVSAASLLRTSAKTSAISEFFFSAASIVNLEAVYLIIAPFLLFYVVVFALTFLYRLFEAKTPPLDDLPSVLHLEKQEGTHMRGLFMPEETHVAWDMIRSTLANQQSSINGEGGKIHWHVVHIKQPGLSLLSMEKTNQAINHLLSLTERVTPRLSLPIPSLLRHRAIWLGVRLRKMLLAMTPRPLLKYMVFIIPFGIIDFREALKNIRIAEFEEIEPGRDQMAYGTSFNNMIFLGKKTIETLTEAQLAGLIARKLIEIQAKHIVRAEDLPWVPLVGRIAGIGKAWEIAIAGPGRTRGRSSVDDNLRKLENPKEYYSTLPVRVTNAWDIMQSVQEKLEASRQEKVVDSAIRTRAWEWALDALIMLYEYPLPSAVRESNDFQRHLDQFEKMLLDELAAGAVDISATAIRRRFASDWERLGGDPEIPHLARGLKKANPKDLISHLILLYMLQRRELPRGLSYFLMDGRKIENWNNLSMAALTLISPFGNHVEQLLRTLHMLWPAIAMDDRGILMGHVTELLRHLTRSSETLYTEQGLEAAKMILSNLIDKLPDSHPSNRMISEVLRTRHQLEGLREILPLSSRLKEPFDPQRPIPMHGELDDALTYLDRIQNDNIDVLRQCLIAYVRALQDEPQDTTRAMQAALDRYIALIERGPNIPNDLPAWQAGPGEQEIPIYTRHYHNVVRSRTLQWSSAQTALEELLTDPQYQALSTDKIWQPLADFYQQIYMYTESELAQDSERLAAELRGHLLGLRETLIARSHATSEPQKTFMRDTAGRLSSLAEKVWSIQTQTIEIQTAAKKPRRLVFDVAFKPIETLFIGYPAAHRSMDFMRSFRKRIAENLRSHWDNPWIHAVYAFADTRKGAKRDRIARLSVARTQEGPMVIISTLSSTQTELELFSPFLTYFKKWADISELPVIVPLFMFEKYHDQLIANDYRLIEAPIVLTIRITQAVTFIRI